MVDAITAPSGTDLPTELDWLTGLEIEKLEEEHREVVLCIHAS